MKNILVSLHSFNLNGILKTNLSFIKYVRKNFPEVRVVVAAPDVNQGIGLYTRLGIEVCHFESCEQLIETLKKVEFEPDIILRESFFSKDVRLLVDRYRAAYLIRVHDEIPLFESSKDWFIQPKSAKEYFKEIVGASIVFASENTRRYYKDLLGEQRFTVIHPAINEDELQAYQPDDRAGEDFRILQLGTVYKRKGCLETLEAFWLFLQEFPGLRARLTFVGARRANDMENAYVDNLEKKIQALNLTHCVEVLPSVPNPYSTLDGFDLLTLHSESECFPLVVQEALCLGRPVVSSDVGGISEIIDSPTTGGLFSAGDVEGQAALFAQIYKKQLIEDGAEAIQEVYRESYSSDVLNRRLFDYVRNVADARAAECAVI